MLVVMALVTTMMTSPLLNLLGVEDKSAKQRNLVAVGSA
jgi:hypothetical protein